MTKRCFAVAVLFVCASAVCASACGDDDGSGDEMPSAGTCDLRAVSSSCIELHDAEPGNVSAQEDACLEQGGDWSNDACPSEESIGCCEYTFGNAFRQCFYPGTTRDPVAYCMMFDDGVWVPAS